MHHTRSTTCNPKRAMPTTILERVKHFQVNSEGRKCTDCYCCVLYIFFVVVWVGVAGVAVRFGNVFSLYYGRDHQVKIEKNSSRFVFLLVLQFLAKITNNRRLARAILIVTRRITSNNHQFRTFSVESTTTGLTPGGNHRLMTGVWSTHTCVELHVSVIIAYFCHYISFFHFAE